MKQHVAKVAASCCNDLRRLCQINQRVGTEVTTQLVPAFTITDSPAGLSRVNGDRRSSAKTRNFNHLPKPNLWINWFEIWKGDYVMRFSNPAKVWWRSFRQWRPHVVVEYTGRVPFITIINIIFVFIYLDMHTAYTREPILTHNSSKDADWLNEVPFKQVFFDIFYFWG